MSLATALKLIEQKVESLSAGIAAAIKALAANIDGENAPSNIDGGNALSIPQSTLTYDGGGA